MIDNRARIIDAAARVYAAHGYRGATTRRIAEEAGVNEVTIFRQFDLLRQIRREFSEHPDHAACAGEGPAVAAAQLRDYVLRLRRAGLLDTTSPNAASAPEVGAAVAMLMSALFVDAMDRELMPHLFTTAADEAPRAYVRLFLRGIGCCGADAKHVDAHAPAASTP